MKTTKKAQEDFQPTAKQLGLAMLYLCRACPIELFQAGCKFYKVGVLSSKDTKRTFELAKGALDFLDRAYDDKDAPSHYRRVSWKSVRFLETRVVNG